MDAEAAKRGAYVENLQERARAGRIHGYEVGYWLSRFDNGEPIAVRQAEDALKLKEARQIAAAAKMREGAEQTKERENHGRER